MSLSPKVVPKQPAAEPTPPAPIVQVVLPDKFAVKEQVIVKETAPAPKGWRFVPHRDENNLIVEIIATPIE